MVSLAQRQATLDVALGSCDEVAGPTSRLGAVPVPGDRGALTVDCSLRAARLSPRSASAHPCEVAIEPAAEADRKADIGRGLSRTDGQGVFSGQVEPRVS